MKKLSHTTVFDPSSAIYITSVISLVYFWKIVYSSIKLSVLIHALDYSNLKYLIKNDSINGINDNIVTIMS